MTTEISKDHCPELVKLVLDLHEAGAVKFGKFKLKSGIDSPIYIDLRVIYSDQKGLLNRIADFIWKASPKKNWDSICGVPYTGIYMACKIHSNNPSQKLTLVNRSKEAKSYGTKKSVVGVYKKGQTCLIIEDLIVSGSSIYETAKDLWKENVIVTDAVVLLDRMQGGVSNLKKEGINVSSVIDIGKLLKILRSHHKIQSVQYEECEKFLSRNSSVAIPISSSVKKLSFQEKSLLATHPLVKKLYDLVLKKKTNLCFAADVNTTSELLRLADLVGPHICVLKTHIDILIDFTKETITKLKDLSSRHNFLLFEDRKFADIGKTVKNQFSGGLYNISDWADIVTVHGVPGTGVIKALSSAMKDKKRGILIVSEMSTEGNLCNLGYVKGCIKIAEDNPAHVIGFVAQNCLSTNPNHLIFTPGIHLNISEDCFGLKYVPIEEAILERGTAIIIVGRDIASSDDPKLAASTYQERGFRTLMKI